MIRDRLSWMRFLDFDLGGPTPDENTIRLFRNKLTETGALKRVMKAFDWQLQKKGYIPMSGGSGALRLSHRAMTLYRFARAGRVDPHHRRTSRGRL